MKKLVLYILFTVSYLYASDLKNNQDQMIQKTLVENKSFIDSISIGFGKIKSKHGVFKLGLQKEFTSNIYENEIGYLNGFYDLSLNRWNYTDSEVYAVAFSPVFEYSFKTNSSDFIPFINIGIGATYINKKSIDDRNFSTHFQFEDRIGMGIKSSKYKLSFNYFHYSNASIKKPNDGIDMMLINYIYTF